MEKFFLLPDHKPHMASILKRFPSNSWKHLHAAATATDVLIRHGSVVRDHGYRLRPYTNSSVPVPCHKDQKSQPDVRSLTTLGKLPEFYHLEVSDKNQVFPIASAIEVVSELVRQGYNGWINLWGEHPEKDDHCCGFVFHKQAQKTKEYEPPCAHVHLSWTSDEQYTRLIAPAIKFFETVHLKEFEPAVA